MLGNCLNTFQSCEKRKSNAALALPTWLYTPRGSAGVSTDGAGWGAVGGAWAGCDVEACDGANPIAALTALQLAKAWVPEQACAWVAAQGWDASEPLAAAAA